MLPASNYVLRVDACPAWRDYRTVTLGMCMGNENWEGEKLVAVLEWVSRHFDFIRIALSDTLGRHNFVMRGMEPAEALWQALRQGDDWLERNTKFLKACGKPYGVVRWDHWRKHPEYEATHEEFKFLASNERQLADAVDREAAAFADRLAKRGLASSGDIFAHCRAYLIEELAGTTLRARAIERSCRVYPAPEPAWLKLVRAGAIEGAPRGLEKEYYVAVNLRRRKGQAQEMGVKAA